MSVSAAKRNANIVIGAVLALLILLPLSYYTVRDDRNDERFAWRMFSSIRAVRCKVRWRIGTDHHIVQPYRIFHEAWINIARRGRQSVYQPMTAKLCEDNPGQAVYLDLACRGIDGTVRTIEDGAEDACQ